MVYGTVGKQRIKSLVQHDGKLMSISLKDTAVGPEQGS
jgi:hypothetical protein